MKRMPQAQRTARVRRQRDVLAFPRLSLLLFCAVILACGFVFAAKQHFAAVQYGYQNESLRREKQQLLEEQHRLLLEKERASSPQRLEPAALRLGLRAATSRQIASVKARQSLESQSSNLPDTPSGRVAAKQRVSTQTKK
jgi:cell division protein FtsL